MTFRFEERYVTASSAQWSILDEAGAPCGRVDAHFEPGRARVTAIVPPSTGDEAIEDLVATIDEQLVTAMARGDVRVTVYRGESAGTFAPEA